MLLTIRSLTTEIVKEFFDYKDGALYWRKCPHRRPAAGSRAGTINSCGYRMIRFRGLVIAEHRLVWVWHGNELCQGMHIDHINHDRLDNRVENLQQITRSENFRRRKYVTEATGVTYHKRDKRWQARAPWKDGKLKHLGYFLTKEEAIAARKGYDLAQSKD